MTTNILPILFENVNERIVGQERNSKLLKHDSDLVKFLDPIRNSFKQKYPNCDCRPWHIELSHGRRREKNTSDGSTNNEKIDNDSLVLSRAKDLHGTPVDVGDISNYGIMSGKALVFNTPKVEGYGDTHATIAYFRSGIDDTLRKDLFDTIEKYILKTFNGKMM